MAHQTAAREDTVGRVIGAFKHGALNSAGKTVRKPRLGAMAVAAFLLLVAGPAMAQPARTPDASGPQSAVPAPVTSGKADVPGGSARNGVIKPPEMNGAMPIVQPPSHGVTPIIPPPGTPGNDPHLQPK